MKLARATLGVLGIAVFGLAVITIFAPEAAAGVPVDDAVAALGNDYLLVGVFGVMGFAVVLGTVSVRSVRGIDQATPPSPEGIPTGPRPGESLDRLLERGPTLRERLFTDHREEVREQLRETAVRTLMRTSNCTRAAALERIEQGTWTDDPEAAAYLGADGGTSRRWSDAVAALRGESGFQRRARRTARAIVRLDEEGPA